MFYIICFFALLYILFDVNYFVRTVFTVLSGRLCEIQRNIKNPKTIYGGPPFLNSSTSLVQKMGPPETHNYQGFCFTQDLDIMFRHMNNARFVRDLDFARFHFYDGSGLYDEVTQRNGHALQAATNIRYRRVIPFLTFYKVVTQLIYWDDRAVYLEHKFIKVRDGFVHAVALSKQMICHIDVPEIMETLNAGPKPELSKDLELWIKSNEASSEKLRPFT